MVRYVCPPWYECRCILGKPVSRSTMLSHRRVANKRRRELGLGPFAWGPKVSHVSFEHFEFHCLDSLVDHPSDVDGNCGRLVLHENSFIWEQTESPNAGGNENHRVDHDEPATHNPNLSPKASRLPRNSTLSGDFEAQSLHESAVLTSVDIEGEARSSFDERYGLQRIHPDNGDVSEVLMTRSPEVPSHDAYQQLMPNSSDSSSDDSTTFGEARIADSLGADNSRGQQSHPLQMCNDETPQPTRRTSIISNPELPCHETPNNSAFQRNPELLPWLVANPRWVDLYEKYALPEAVMDEILEIVGAPCKQWKTVISNVCNATGLNADLQVYSSCPGHMAFVPDPETDDMPESCSECSAPMPSEPDSRNRYLYLPLVPRLLSMISKPETCESLYRYRKSRESEADVIRDFFDGSSYRRLCERFGGSERMAEDIFVLASTDGFTPFKNRLYDMWSISAINFNLHPSQRYAPQNVLPLAFIPGPRQPKDLQSFLRPLVIELKAASQGKTVTFPDGSQRPVRVHLIGFTGDQPAVSKISGLVGHNGRSPCRDCSFQGFFSNHYYFPSKIKINNSRTRVIFNLRQLPMRDASESLATVGLLRERQGSEKKSLQTETGIREGSPLFAIDNFIPYSSFPHDIMHTFYNTQNELLSIILGPHDDDFTIDKPQLKLLDQELEGWRWGISGQLGPAPKSLSRFREWKAAEHKIFSISHSLVLFDGYLPVEYLNGLKVFSELVDLCTRAEVRTEEVEKVRTLSVKFMEHFERCYYKYRENRVDFCKSVFHILLHLSDCMARYGPLIGVSQYWLEGYIGWVGGRNNSKTRPAESMMKNAIFNESSKRFYGRVVYQKESDALEVIENGGFLAKGSPRTTSLSKQADKGRRIRKLLTDYFCRKFNVAESIARTAALRVEDIDFYSGFKFMVGSDMQCASTHFRRGTRDPIENHIRPSCYVAVEMEGNSESHFQVWYGRLLQVLSVDLRSSFSSQDDDCQIPPAKYDVMVIDWAKHLRKGGQGHVFAENNVKCCFSEATIEDIVIVKRLLKAVEHRVPVRSDGARGAMNQRLKTRTYFIDDGIEIDNLLSTGKPSTDGVDRVLMGFSR